MTEVSRVHNAVYSTYISPMVRLFSAEYVTLRSVSYESEYVAVNSRPTPHHNFQHVEQSIVRNSPAIAAIAAIVISSKVVSDMISGIVTLYEGANKSCAIL